MEAAAAEKGEVKILAVTVLTSLDRGDLDDLGFQVRRRRPGAVARAPRARRGLRRRDLLGARGAAAEARARRPRLLVVTPGIRPVENRPVDDQKRTVDVAQAFANGADYIVVGRPIRNAPDPTRRPQPGRSQSVERALALFPELSGSVIGSRRSRRLGHCATWPACHRRRRTPGFGYRRMLAAQAAVVAPERAEQVAVLDIEVVAQDHAAVADVGPQVEEVVLASPMRLTQNGITCIRPRALRRSTPRTS